LVDFTIEELLKKGIDMLGKGDFTNPLLDCQLLLSNVLNVDKVYIYTHKNQIVSNEAVDKFLQLINKRKEGYPLQYIIGKQEFMGLEFYVDNGVLIPRPDTEILVEAVINMAKEGFSNKERINIVDIGTGSGAITLSLAHYIKNSFVFSIDISDKALEIAKINCNRLNLNDKVKFIKGSLFEPLWDLDLRYNIDIVVSNPPYIPSQDIDDLQVEVSKYEPRIALDGGWDGLDFYRLITRDSMDYLRDKGILAFEIGYNQGEDVRNILESSGGFKDVSIIKDLAGHDRVVIGYKD